MSYVLVPNVLVPIDSTTRIASWHGFTWRLPTQCDHCSGYSGSVEPDSIRSGVTWLVVQTSGDTMTWGSASTPVTSFAQGLILAEGTYAEMLAYRDGL